jgi:hypothetical protein
MRERPALRLNEPGKSAEDVVARALAILEEETRTWKAVREHRLTRSHEAVRPGEAAGSDLGDAGRAP